MDPVCQQGIVQAGGGSVMVWSVFSWILQELQGKLQSVLERVKYTNSIADHLHLFVFVMSASDIGLF